MGPEPRGVADKDRLRTGCNRAFKRVEAAAVPPVGARISAAAVVDWIVEMDRNGQAHRATSFVQTQRVRIIKWQAHLQLGGDLHAVDFDCGLEPVYGVGPLGMRHVAEDKAIGRFSADGQHIFEGNPQAGGGQHRVIRRRVFICRDLPREKPHLVDTLLVHVAQDFGGVKPVPIGMIMRVNKHLLMIFLRAKTVKIK